MENVKEKIYMDKNGNLICKMTFDPAAAYPISVELVFSIGSGGEDGEFWVYAKHDFAFILIGKDALSAEWDELPEEMYEHVKDKIKEIEDWRDFDDYLDVAGLRSDFFESQQSEQMQYLGHNRGSL